MNAQQALQLSSRKFRRYFGISRRTFHQMLWVVQNHAPAKLKSGRPTKLCVEDQVLVTLDYWREYRTFFHIAEDWGVSESTVCRTVQAVETRLIQSGVFSLPGKKHLIQAEIPPEAVAMDVTESPIERPQRDQRSFYSGKKQRHTFKSLLVVNLSNRQVSCAAHGKGRRHDFKVFKASGIRFHPQTEAFEDKGFQGLRKLHANSHTPKKKPRGEQLSLQDKRHNRALAQQRVVVEHVNRSLKIFKILSERYRNRRRRFGLRCNIIAGLYNYELCLSG